MKKIGIGIAVVLLIAALGSCGGKKETQYDRDFKSGMEKYNSGQEMTEGEYKAVKNYENWKDSQGTKTYEEWDD